MRVRVELEEAVDHGVGGRVAEDESPLAWGEDDDGGLRAAQNAELAGLLEETCPALGEGDFQRTFLLNLFYLDLLPPHALFLHDAAHVRHY